MRGVAAYWKKDEFRKSAVWVSGNGQERCMRKWFQKFWDSGWFIPFVLLLPYVCTIALNGAEKALLLHSTGEEYLVPLVLMVQMKGDYEDEAVKAQAVIARSEVYRRLENGESEGEILGEVSESLVGKNMGRTEQMEVTTEAEDGEALSEKIAEISKNRGFIAGDEMIWKLLSAADKLQQYGNAVEATAGQVLTYNGELKLVPYHEVSSGKTRDGAEVFHSKEYAYLKSVDSSQDKEAPDYVNGTYVAVSQLPAKLVIKKRDSAGYVTALTADGKWIEGETFRQGMHMASADFSVQKVGKMVRFLCKGKGHGLGFSQYGGNEMAKKGSGWQEILEVYFPEMEIEAVDSLR